MGATAGEITDSAMDSEIGAIFALTVAPTEETADATAAAADAIDAVTAGAKIIVVINGMEMTFFHTL